MKLPVLTHYSLTPVTDVYSVQQPPKEMPYKPEGLWISVDSDYGWAEWCRDNEFRLEHLQYCHQVEIAANANVLVLSGDAAISGFTASYGKPCPYARGNGARVIHWDKVANDYQGVLIPYFSRHHHNDGDAWRWYYGWDCASGCIWDAAAIAACTNVILEMAEAA